MAWKRIMVRALAVVLTLLIATSVSLYLILRSHRFHEYVRTRIIAKLAEATGGKVELGGFAFDWHALRVDLNQLVIHGNEKPSQQPFFRVDRITMTFRIISALRRQVELSQIHIERPVLHLLVDKEGKSNFPGRRVGRQETQPPDLFDLAIKQFLLERGVIYYNDNQKSFSAALQDLRTKISFDPVQTLYSGYLTYRQGRVAFGALKEFPHDLEAQFNAGRTRASLNCNLTTAGPSRIAAQISLSGYERPLVESTYQAWVSSNDLRQLLNNPSLPQGYVSVTGSARYRSQPDQSWLDGLFMTGHLSSPSVTVRLPDFSLEVREIGGRYQLEKDHLDLNSLEANMLGGRVLANLAVGNLLDQPEFRLKSSAAGLSLNAIASARQSKSLASPAITGSLDGEAEAKWEGALQKLIVRSDGTVKATTELPSGNVRDQGSHVPLEGEFHFSYDGAKAQLALTQTSLQGPHTAVHLDGILGDHCSLKVKARTDDLRELERIALNFGPSNATSAGPPSPQALGLTGSASFDGTMEGSLKDPRITGQLSARDLGVRGSRWRSLRTGVHLGASTFFLRQGSLESSNQGNIHFELEVGMRDWKYIPSAPLTAKVSVAEMPLAEIGRAAQLKLPVSGILSARVSLHGSQLNPLGEGTAQLTQAKIQDEPVQNLTLQFQATGDRLASSINARLAAGSVTGNLVVYPKNQGYEVQVEAPGIRLDRLMTLRSKHLPIQGLLTASVQGQGTLKEPRLEAQAEIGELRVHQEIMRGLKARASLDHQQLKFNLDSSVATNFVQVKGEVDLTSDYNATAKLDTRGIVLESLLATYLPGRAGELRGQIELHGELRGPLKNPNRLEARIEIPVLSTSYQSMQLASTTPIRLNYRNGLLDLERVTLKGTGTEVQVQGSIPLRSHSPFSLSASGTVNLELLKMLNPDLDSSGELALNIVTAGDRAHPRMEGQARIVNGSFATSTAPLGLQNLNGELTIQPNRIEIKQVVAKSGGGDVQVHGFVTYQSGVRFNISIDGNHIRLRYPEGMRSEVDPHLVLQGTPQASSLSGRVLVNRLSFTQEFDLGTFLAGFASQAPASAPEGATKNLTLDVGLQSTENLGLMSSKLTLQGQANLRVRGTAARPVVLGRANVTDGEIFFLNKRYRIERGVVDFVNPSRTEPVINLLVTTVVNQYNLSLNFSGSLDNLRTNYVSDPPLPPVDIINLLTVGKTTEGANTPSSLGANSVLAQGLASQVSSRVEKLAGLSSLQIDPLIGNNQRNPSARLAIQHRVTKDFIFTYATDVTSTQREVIQAEYQISPRWSVTAVRDENGSFAVDFRLRKSF